MTRADAPWRVCPHCGHRHAATICHLCKTPAPVPADEPDEDLERAYLGLLPRARALGAPETVS